MKRYKKILGIIEKILFIALLIIVIIIASGYKYDPVRKELVQTGVLKIENLENNTTLYFNNEKYDNKNNLSVSLLDENSYELKVTKKNRKAYDTKIQINPGEVTYINPVLIPDIIKPTIMRATAENIVANDKSMFYTYTENNLIYLERLNINKTLFNVDLNKSKIDITNFISKDKTISIHTGNTNNYVILTNGEKVLLADYNKLSITDITTSLPQEKIVSIEILNDFIIIKYKQSLYSINVADPLKIQRSLVFNSKNFLYSVNENNEIIIFYINETNQNIIEMYNLNGVQQGKSILSYDTPLTTENMSLIYFYKNIYLYKGSVIYKIVNNKIVEFQKDVTKYTPIDINNFLILTDTTAYLLSRERYIHYPLNSNNNINVIQVLPDLFNYLYVDKQNALHIADFGGQDNKIAENAGEIFLSSQSGSDTYIVYKTQDQIQNIRFGNTK